MKQSKSAFSFVELIIVLILLFVMLASFMPLITRKHLTPPSKVNHGTYACYRKQNNQLHQTLIKGTKVVENDIAVAKCTFDPPKKAKYFYVQLIGGGGGGRDVTAYESSPYNYSTYQIYGQDNSHRGYVVTGCYSVSSSGSCSSQSGAYRTNIFSNEQTWFDLVKEYKVGVYGTGYAGQVCDPSSYYGSQQGAQCDTGLKDGTPNCEATSYDNCESYPNKCYNSGSRKYYQLTCPSPEGTSCPRCKEHNVPNNGTCDLETNTGEGCFATAVPQTADYCYNNRSGTANYFYAQIPLKYLYKTSISSSSYRAPDKSVLYNNISIDKAYDGYGQKYSWTQDGNSQYIQINGASGGIKGFEKRYNPYYGPGSEEWVNQTRYCSPSTTYTAMQPSSSYYDPNKLYSAYCESSNPTLYPCKSASSLSSAQSNSYNNSTAFSFKDLKIGDINISQKQSIPYGVGGKAGQIKTMIFKELKEDLPMHPGRGGAIGVKGEDTTFGGGDSGIPLKIAYGGPAGAQLYTMDVNISPYMSDGSYQWTQPAGQWRTATTKSIAARQGETVSYNSYIRFIISYKNENIIEIMKNFGRGGDGGATMTDCTFGYSYQPITLERSITSVINKIVPTGRENVSPLKLKESGFKCNGKYTWYTSSSNSNDETQGYYRGYWRTSSGTDNTSVKIDEPATEGGAGAIVISW